MLYNVLRILKTVGPVSFGGSTNVNKRGDRELKTPATYLERAFRFYACKCEVSVFFFSMCDRTRGKLIRAQREV